MKARGPPRPKVGEDEDELLAAQESFMRESAPSAAAVARAGPPPKIVAKSPKGQPIKEKGIIAASARTPVPDERRVNCMSQSKTMMGTFNL